MINKLKKIFNHISNGTVLNRYKDRKKVAAHKIWLKFIQSNDKAIIKELSPDVKIKLYRDSSLSESLYCYDFEQEEIAFLNKFLTKGDIFFDIGANVGLFTVHASKIVGANGKIFAFEPAKITHERLVENVKLNNRENVVTNKIAISDFTGEQEFFVSAEGYDAFNSIVKPAKGEKYNNEMVKVVTIDDYVSSQNLVGKIKYMKIDVEGWEVPLFNGGKKIFSALNAPTLMVEFTEQNAISAGHTCNELFHQLVAYGYKLFTYNMSKNELIEEKLRDNYYDYINVIAVKNPEILKEKFSVKYK